MITLNIYILLAFLCLGVAFGAFIQSHRKHIKVFSKKIQSQTKQWQWLPVGSGFNPNTSHHNIEFFIECAEKTDRSVL